VYEGARKMSIILLAQVSQMKSTRIYAGLISQF
jgi:hypothetical protein